MKFVATLIVAVFLLSGDPAWAAFNKPKVRKITLHDVARELGMPVNQVRRGRFLDTKESRNEEKNNRAYTTPENRPVARRAGDRLELFDGRGVMGVIGVLMITAAVVLGVQPESKPKRVG